jgi:hypothetical protein
MFSGIHNWDSFLYQFLVGGVIFLFGIAAPLAYGDVSLKRKDDRRTVIWISAGTVIFILFTLAWQFYAIKGG